MTSPAPLHPNQCRCDDKGRCMFCATQMRAQYQSWRDGAMRPTATDHPAIRTTPPDQVGAGLDMSLRFLEPIRERADTLEYILLAILHGSERLRDDIDSGTWPDRIYGDTLKRLKALADEDAERKAMR